MEHFRGLCYYHSLLAVVLCSTYYLCIDLIFTTGGCFVFQVLLELRTCNCVSAYLFIV